MAVAGTEARKGHRRFAMAALTVVSVFALSSCGNGDETEPEDAAAVEAPAVAPTPAAPAGVTATPPPVAAANEAGAALPQPPAVADTPPPGATPPPAPGANPPPEPAAAAAEPTPAAPEPAPTPTPPQAAAPPQPEAPPVVAAGDPPIDADLRVRVLAADPATGAAAGAVCLACHVATPNGIALIGPNLYGILNAPVARNADFNYSPGLRALNAAGATWTVERLDAFLADPDAAVPGTRMTLPGIEDGGERAAIIAWLRTLAPEPVNLAVEGGATVGRRLPGLMPITYAAAQVSPGRDYYNRVCARCHGDDFFGRIDTREWGSAPALTGPRFIRRWYDRTVWDVFVHMRDAVDPAFHPRVSDERYAQVLAYILEQQGFAAGTTPLATDQAILERMGFWQ